MNPFKKNNILISVFLVLVLILGKGFHQYIDLKMEKRNNEEKILGLARNHISNLLISVKSKDEFLIRESLRPFISLPFVSGIKIRAKKTDIININKKNMRIDFCFLKYLLKIEIRIKLDIHLFIQILQKFLSTLRKI